MARFLARVLALIGGITVFTLLGIAATLLLVFPGAGRLTTPAVPARTLLDVDLEPGLAEYVPDNPAAAFLQGRTPVLRDVLDGLERAAGDARVVGLVANIGGTLPLAQIQELRDAIATFRHAGKPAAAFAETFGEGGGGNGAYYLATACDEIWLQPSGEVGLTGLLVESPFLRGTLDKLGVVPRLDHRFEYKNAMNMFTDRSYTPAQAEATRAVMMAQFGQIVGGIATARGLTEDGVRALIDRGPLLASEALEAKLVDGLGYRDQIWTRLEDRTGKPTRLSLAEYLRRAGRPHDSGPTIALVYGVGGVQRGKSGFNPLFEGVTMGSDTVSAALRDAARDDSVKAILFRVDSPGGSYVASDAIWRATVRARDAGKPLIVSMGSVAASGGYFVAMHADRIVAQPATITGSIGVFGGKMLTGGLWDKLGVSWDEVHSSTNATMWSGLSDYTPEEWSRFQASLDAIYGDFTSKVAAERKLPPDKVLALARGRIWTGEQAKALGLVDELGGFAVALRVAREAVGLAPDAAVQLKIFPRPKTLLETVVARLLGEEEDEEAADGALASALRVLQPIARIARELGLGGDGSRPTARVPESWLRSIDAGD